MLTMSELLSDAECHDCREIAWVSYTPFIDANSYGAEHLICRNCGDINQSVSAFKPASIKGGQLAALMNNVLEQVGETK